MHLMPHLSHARDSSQPLSRLVPGRERVPTDLLLRSIAPAFARAGLSALLVLSVVLPTSTVQARERVLVCPFEGPRAAPLRWRVSSVVKKARHTSLRYKAPPSNANDTRLIRYARRRIIDAFIFGTVEQDDDDGSWTLRLVIKGPDAEILDDSLIYEGATLRELVRVLKREGRIDLREAVLPYEEEDGDSEKLPSAVLPDSDLPVSDSNAGDVDLDGDNSDNVDSRELVEAPDSYQQEDDSGTDVDLDVNSESKPKTGKKRLQAFFGVSSKKKKKTSKKRRFTAAASDDWNSDSNDAASQGDGDNSNSPDPLIGSSEELLVADVAYSASDKRMPLLRFGVGGGLVSRELLYVSNIYGRLRDQNTAAWVYQLRAELFPFAPPLNDRISLIAGFDSNVAGSVNDAATGDDYGVSFSEYYAGLRVKQPIGRHALRGQVTIGSMSSGLDDPDDQLNVPDYAYSLVRASLAGVVNLSQISLEAYAGYQMPLGYGEVGEDAWFPRIEGAGFEAGAGLTYPLSGKVSLALNASLRRLNLDMNALPQDAISGAAEVAGGATDTYISGSAGVTINL